MTAIEPTNERSSNGSVIWICKCDCGNYAKVSSKEFSAKSHVKGCGCGRFNNKPNLTHGGKHERLYQVWMSMRRRCNDKKDHSYHIYGERGIKVCKEWEDYANFREWATSNGYDETAPYGECTLDRIDSSKGYSPDNCRFVPMSVQDNNKRNNRFITYNGETKTITQWEQQIKCAKGFVRDRLDRGWSVEEALTTPPKYNNKYNNYLRSEK